MTQMDNLLTRLSDLEEWADANEYEVPINLGDTLREAMEEIRKLTAERDAAVTDLKMCMRRLGKIPQQWPCDVCGNPNKPKCWRCEPEWRGCTRPESKEDVCTKN
jgi:hypothetical protein